MANELYSSAVEKLLYLVVIENGDFETRQRWKAFRE
jgi:hypothetical protein